MEIDSELADQALRAALEKYPQFAAFGPRLVARALFQGAAFMLEYDRQPPAGDPRVRPVLALRS